MDDIESVLKRWTDAEEIRLRAGEIDRETMRTVLAVTNGMAREVRRAYEANENNLLGLLGGADALRDTIRRRLRELVKEIDDGQTKRD